MKNRYHLIASLLTLATVSAQAQVKIGSNPTSLTTTANLQVEATDGSQVVINKTTGNVGIGTVAPGAKLHVLNGNVIFNPTGTNPLNFNSGNTATNPRLSVPRGAIEFQSGETSGGTPIFNFFSNVGGEAMNRLTVLQNGNVGIGTASPTESLHITNNAAGGVGPISTGLLRLENMTSSPSMFFRDPVGLGIIGTLPVSFAKDALVGGEFLAGGYYSTRGFAVGGAFSTANPVYNFLVTLDGKVGIGTTAPSNKLEVKGGNIVVAGSNVNDWSSVFSIARDGSTVETNAAYLQLTPNNSLFFANKHPSNGGFVFGTASPTLAGNAKQAMEISYDGNVGIGSPYTTGPNSKLHIVGERLYMDCTAADPYGAITINVPNTNSNGALDISEMILFTVAGSAIGNIAPTAAGTGISFNTNSDRRLKENIVTSHYGIKDLMKINVVDYNFKSNKNKMQETGFVAQDLYKVYPIAVTPGDADETAAVKDSWKVDYGKVTPLLVKSIQDQQAIINAQQAEINELKAAVKQLLEKK